ncbi:MAG TPA: hypothetical protein VG897_13615 [Terriglobales bacterium]|nr:hypothetical protein [Terriglobales bacterium]
MIGSFLSEALAGDTNALIIVALFLGVVALLWKTPWKKAKEEAEISTFHAIAAKGNLETVKANAGVHPNAIHEINIRDKDAEHHSAGRKEEADIRIRVAQAQADISAKEYEHRRAVDVKYLRIADRWKEKMRERRQQQRPGSRPGQARDGKDVGPDIPEPERTTEH